MGIVSEPTGKRLLQASELTGEYTLKWEPTEGQDVSTFVYDLLQHSPPQSNNTKAESDIVYVNDLLVARGWTSPNDSDDPTLHDPTTRVSYLIAATENPVGWPQKLAMEEEEVVPEEEEMKETEVEIEPSDLPPVVEGEEISL
jgi:hypothetical protein